MSDIDWIGKWFELYEQAGDRISILFGSQDHGSESIQWKELPHTKFDGIGAFGHIIREETKSHIPLPKSRHVKSPSWFSTFQKRLEMDEIPDSKNAYWSVGNSDSPQLYRPLCTVFSATQTVAMETRAEGQECSLNALLLFHLSQVVKDYLVDPTVKQEWMVPINMRGAIHRHNDTSNHVAFLPCEIINTSTPKEIYFRISEKLKSGHAWHCWRYLNIGKAVGKWGMKKIFDSQNKPERRWTGVFSNLGVWDTSSSKNWFFSPPLTNKCPLASGALKHNGQLTLALHVHPNWKDSEEIARLIFSRWKSKILLDINVS